MQNSVEKISVVLPVYNEDENIDFIHGEIKKVFELLGHDYEMIFVDDGSTDGSLDRLKKLKKADQKVIYVSLSRNFGHQNAIFAGMNYATGDAVITMDADMQHPPSLIPKMIDLWRRGVEIVYTTKKEYRLPLIKKLIIRISYWFISHISGLKLGFGQSDFRLIDKKVLDVILTMPEYHKFLRGQMDWIGFRKEGLSYNVEKRRAGKPKYSYRKLSELALNGIFSFGKYPLHLVLLFSLFILAVSSIYILSIMFIWVLKLFNIVAMNMPPGWTTIAMAVVFLGSLQLIAIGILSEYVGRIYDQTKGRPIFIVRESSEKR